MKGKMTSFEAKVGQHCGMPPKDKGGGVLRLDWSRLSWAQRRVRGLLYVILARKYERSRFNYICLGMD